MSQALISDALVISRKRPRRSLISFFIRWYSILVAVSITLIIILSTMPHDPVLAVAILVVYWSYLGAKLYIQRHDKLKAIYRSEWVQLGRSVVLVLGISLWLGYIYLRTDHSTHYDPMHTLWLLLLLAVLIMSQRGVTELMLATVAFASVCLAMVSLIAAGGLTGLESNLTVVLDISVKTLWLVLLAFVLHVLIRYLGDFNASVRLLHNVHERIHDLEARIIESTTVAGEKELLETAVNLIASDFKYPHVNTFFLQSDGRLKCMAGACPAGQSLAREGYCLEPGVGILGYVVAKKGSHCSNNVDNDLHFYRHPAFPATKSELGVVISVADEVIGALDIQTHRRDSFLEHDVEVMEIMAGYLGMAIENIRMHGWRQRIVEILESISSRLLSEYELEGTLQGIARAAHEEFSADIVVLYDRDPLCGSIAGPVYAGDPREPEIFARTKLEPDSLVYRLLSASEESYFHEDIQTVPKTPPFASSGFHVRTGKPDFATREGVKSRAIIRLKAQSDCVGLMFLNFRSPQRFTEHEKRMFFTFAHLAALAIQKAQFHQQQILLEREEMARSLHDQLMSHTYGLSQLVEALLNGEELSARHREYVQSAWEAVRDLRRDIKYLNQMLKDTSLDGLPREVEKLIERVEGTYGVQFSINWAGPGERIPAPMGRELRLILNEAVLNGIRHGHATEITVSFEVTDNQVLMIVEDNGSGFDTDDVGQLGGIANMRNRVARMGGEFAINSTPGEGTRLMAAVPVKLVSRRRQ